MPNTRPWTHQNYFYHRGSFSAPEVNPGTQTQCGVELLREEMKLPVGSQLSKVPEGGTSSGTDRGAAIVLEECVEGRPLPSLWLMADPSISPQQLSRGAGKAETLPSDRRWKDRLLLQTNTLQLVARDWGAWMRKTG